MALTKFNIPYDQLDKIPNKIIKQLFLYYKMEQDKQ